MYLLMNVKEKFYSRLSSMLTRKKGEAYLDMLVKILIVVLLGVALLTLLNKAVPELWEDVIDEIRNKFNF